MLRATKITAPKNFEISIVNLDTGFEMSKSIVPFSSIEGINEEAEISEKNKIRLKESDKKPVSTDFMTFCTSVNDTIPSTASRLTAKIIMSTTIA
jgi:hypothetical protein